VTVLPDQEDLPGVIEGEHRDGAGVDNHVSFG
jgi:hypothetical protein